MLASIAKLYVHRRPTSSKRPAARRLDLHRPGHPRRLGPRSMMVPTLIKAAQPELADVTSFLDVGTGVGLLAVVRGRRVAATTIVGIDRWDRRSSGHERTSKARPRRPHRVAQAGARRARRQ